VSAGSRWGAPDEADAVTAGRARVGQGPFDSGGPGAVAGSEPAPALGLADSLRTGTKGLHRQAERSGIVAAILRRRVDRAGYALLLRNLLPAYQALELGLQVHRGAPVGRLARASLARSAAIESDLQLLCGSEWPRQLVLLPAGERYARCVATAREDDGARLVAHAYVRYLGDLNGGRILRRVVADALGLAPGRLAFHEFPAIPDLGSFCAGYRETIDRVGASMPEPARLVDEARVAFQLNIEVSEAVEDALAGGRPSPSRGPGGEPRHRRS
jgi:heme oxygenase (biliverdin-producing, ferredoxin)